MARDRKRAKQRQRRAAQRQAQPSRGGGRQRREPEAQIDPDRTIPDLEHGSSGADIAKAAIAAGAVNPDEVAEELDEEIGAEPGAGEVYADEIAGAVGAAAEVGDHVAPFRDPDDALVRPDQQARQPSDRCCDRVLRGKVPHVVGHIACERETSRVEPVSI